MPPKGKKGRRKKETGPKRRKLKRPKFSRFHLGLLYSEFLENFHKCDRDADVLAAIPLEHLGKAMRMCGLTPSEKLIALIQERMEKELPLRTPPPSDDEEEEEEEDDEPWLEEELQILKELEGKSPSQVLRDRRKMKQLEKEAQQRRENGEEEEKEEKEGGRIGKGDEAEAKTGRGRGRGGSGEGGRGSGGSGGEEGKRRSTRRKSRRKSKRKSKKKTPEQLKAEEEERQRLEEEGILDEVTVDMLYEVLEKEIEEEKNKKKKKRELKFPEGKKKEEIKKIAKMRIRFKHFCKWAEFEKAIELYEDKQYTGQDLLWAFMTLDPKWDYELEPTWYYGADEPLVPTDEIDNLLTYSFLVGRQERFLEKEARRFIRLADFRKETFFNYRELVSDMCQEVNYDFGVAKKKKKLKLKET